MDTLRIVMALALSWAVQGQILVRKRDLTVNVGRSVFFEREDLVFVRDRRGVDCRVEVVDTDPITQRVGTIEPPVSTVWAGRAWGEGGIRLRVLITHVLRIRIA